MAFPTFQTKLPKPQFGGINESAKLVTEKREDVKKLVLENAESSASTVKSLASTSMLTLKNTVSGLMPAVPDTPTTSLQGELSSLINLNLSNPTAGVSKLSSLESSFGTALSGKGKDLTSIISDVESSVDVSSLSSFDQAGLTKNLVKNIPNFEISGGSSVVVEKAVKPKTAQEGAEKEDKSTITTDTENQNTGTNTITADATATQDKSKSEYEKQASKVTIKRSSDGTVYSDNIKSELEVIDKDIFNNLLEDDSFDTHPAIVKFKFENLRQKTTSTDTFIANIKKEQNIDISKEQIDFQVRFNEPFYEFLGYLDNADTIIKKYRPTGIEDTEVTGDKKGLSNRIRNVKAKKQALEKLYNDGGEWSEKILADWESFITIETSNAKTELGTVKTKYTGN
jgi:hypothetical protein|tara:strand:+ start:165 stop:1358 length:1194 start_codon:yes stop_codon:yes gene_type:complete